jgi:hypothetical protein
VGEVVVRKDSKGFYGRFGPTRNFYSLLAATRTHYGRLPMGCWGQIALVTAYPRRLPAISLAVPSVAQNPAFFTFLRRPSSRAYDGSLTPP